MIDDADGDEAIVRWGVARAAKRHRVRQRLAQLLGEILAADLREYPALPSDADGDMIPPENDPVPRAVARVAVQ
jgi:hypothetical protein